MLGAASLYIAERNRPYTRPAYKLIKEVVDEGGLDDFAVNPPCCVDDGFEKKMYSAVRNTVSYADPDIAMGRVVSVFRVFNDA